MKKFTLFILLLAILSSFAFGQSAENFLIENIKQLQYSTVILDMLPTPDSIAAWTKKVENPKRLKKAGVVISPKVPLYKNDTVVCVVAKNATALNLSFKNCHPDAEFYVLGNNKTTVWGPYFPNKLGNITLPVIDNDSVFFAVKRQHQAFELSSFTYFFTDQEKDFGLAGSCNVNVNCDEGTNWQVQRDASVKILSKVGNFTFWCSGTLVNNTANDQTLYILTAMHCGMTFGNEITTQNDFDAWQFYFEYQAPGCANPASEGTLGSQVITGADRIAWSDDQGGETGSDFLLVKLQADSIPSAYNPIFQGWDKSGTISNSGVSVHHPSGDIKKISTYTTPLVSTSYSGTVQDTHWDVVWQATANGHGVTEGGSSGSGLYNAEKLLIGTLTGGSSFCSSPNETDQYGKFSYHWNSNGTADENRLDVWLDPLGLNPATCATLIPPGSTSTAEITQKPTTVAVYPNPFSTDFTISASTFSPFTWVLTSISGQVIATGNCEISTATINTSNLSSGLYLLQISGDTNETIKLVKQ